MEVQVASVVVSHEEFVTLQTTPKELVSEPESNQLLMVLGAVLIAHFPTPYTALAVGWNALWITSDPAQPGLTQRASLANVGVAASPLNGFLTNANGSGDHLTRLIVPQCEVDTDDGSTLEPWPTGFARKLSESLGRGLYLKTDFTPAGGYPGNTLRVVVAYLVVGL